MATDQIYKFLLDHNKPFAVNDIVKGLENQVGKTKIQNALNQLVETQKIIEKSYGKQKIYCVAQKEVHASNDEILEIDRETNSVALKLKEVEDALKDNSSYLKKLEQSMTKKQALEKKKLIEAEIENLHLQIEAYQGKAYDKEDKIKVEKEYGTLLKEYKKRKRLCTDIVEAIFENYPKSKKSLLQEIGIETDDDVNFSIKVDLS